jgi:hypothetical protein
LAQNKEKQQPGVNIHRSAVAFDYTGIKYKLNAGLLYM